MCSYRMQLQTGLRYTWVYVVKGILKQLESLSLNFLRFVIGYAIIKTDNLSEFRFYYIGQVVRLSRAILK